MPYIGPAHRKVVRERGPLCPGDLNYLVSAMIDGYIAKNGMSYQTLNDVMGALEGAKMEFYRRVVVPYEDEKRRSNGDVYTSSVN